jgi:hypothetical protein
MKQMRYGDIAAVLLSVRPMLYSVEYRQNIQNIWHCRSALEAVE